jgi:hypothetical protein
VTSKQLLNKRYTSLVGDLCSLHSDLVDAVDARLAPEWVIWEVECLMGDAGIAVELYDGSGYTTDASGNSTSRRLARPPME